MNKKNWSTKYLELKNRESFEGWRVRETCKMLSTVIEIDAKSLILSETIHESVIELFVKKII